MISPLRMPIGLPRASFSLHRCSQHSRIILQATRLTIALALILGFAAPCSAGDRRAQRPVGNVFAWGGSSPVSFPYTPTAVSGLSGVVAIAAGPGNILAVKSDGSVWGLGYNAEGQLGDGTTTDATTPVRARIMNVVSVAGGQWHSVALKSDGTVWAWGDNYFGQLGDGTNNWNITPTKAQITKVVAIAAGDYHNLALTSDGRVWAWGRNDNGQLGNNSTTKSNTPVPVLGPQGVGYLSDVVAIAAGAFHSVALKSDGTVWAWGGNNNHQLGDGTTTNSGTPVQVIDPSAASGYLSGVMTIASGSQHTMALKSDGTVWAWGWNGTGQLGTGTDGSTPKQVLGPGGAGYLSGVVAIGGSGYHSAALTSDGTVWTWGYGYFGQLGDGTNNSRSAPGQVSGLSGAVAIAVGGSFTVALQSQAVGAAWGQNALGQVGDGSSDNFVYAPRQVSSLFGLAAIAAGGTYNLARLSDGSLWTWGSNNYGLGNGTTTSRTPVRLTSFVGSVAAIAAGDAHSLVLKSDGTVWAWGFGYGTTPELQSGFSGTVALAGGMTHSLVLRNDGTVWASGSNGSGELGNGTTTNTYTPVQVVGPGGIGFLTGVIAIAAGDRYSLVLKSNGTVWAWGLNDYGQLGIGSSDANPHSTPVQVSGLSDVVAIAAGQEHGVALKSDGTVWVWGHNDHYQLGNGTTTDNPTPSPLSGLSAVAAINASSGSAHTLALKSDGTLWGWGLNNAGQLGYGVSGTTPTQLNSLTGPSAIAAGSEHSLAMALSPTAPPPLLSLTITAIPQVMTYGGTRPALTYSVSDAGVVLDTIPACVCTGDSTSNVGQYSIMCSGAEAYGYSITYLPGTLTVNPAPLTVAADNKTMGYGSEVPTLTASYVGLVNGDTPATAIGGTPALQTGVTSATAAGTYPITVGQGTLTAANYTFTFVNGTLTVNPDSLTLYNNFFVTGDVVLGSTSLAAGTGTITIADTDIPKGADIVAAVLYWQTLEDGAVGPGALVKFDNYPVTSAQRLGSELAYTDGGVSGVMRIYRANVLPYLPVADGRRVANGQHTLSLPDNWGSGLPHGMGASLVVVYRVLAYQSPVAADFPLKAVVIYDGAWVPPSSGQLMNQSIRGFYQSATSSGTIAYLYSSSGTWQGTPEPVTITGDQYYVAKSGGAWGAIVLSTPVNSGPDGLLTTWKTAQGYYDARDGTSWVALPGANPDGKDLFVQIDYMCTVLADGTCDPNHTHLPKLEALEKVADAFWAHRINVHFDIGNNYQGQPHIVDLQYAKGGNIIPEEACTDLAGANPPVCIIPNERGVVFWKGGLGQLKRWPRYPDLCSSGGDCTPRFPHGSKDDAHYVVFGHSLGIPAWAFAYGNLVSINIDGNGLATVTTSEPHGLASDAAPRVTIVDAMSQPNLNRIYVPTVIDDHTFTIQTSGVSGPVNNTTDPTLSIFSGRKNTSSGFSDVGGADTVVTLGDWKFCLVNGHVTVNCPADAPQDDSVRINVQAGSLMHELGHSIGLTHGGAYYIDGTYAPLFEVNCKPHYQSVMNYLFQIDLLGSDNNGLDFSSQELPGIYEGQPGDTSSWTVSPTYSATTWYAPTPAFTDQSPASTHCDGTSIMPAENSMYRKNGAVSSLSWISYQDLNFNGKTDDSMHGFDDWDNLDLRQIGATGSHFVEGGVLLPNGGGVLLPNGGGIPLSTDSGAVLLPSGGVLLPDGSVILPNGSGVLLPNGGGVLLPNGGGVLLPNGGGVLLPNGGGVLLPNGGGVLLPNGGGVLLPNGGGVLLPNGGGVLLPNGGGVLLPNGGGVLLPNGGGIPLPTVEAGGVLLPNGGGVLLPNGGGVLLPNGGGVLLPNGGGVLLPNGGGVLLPNGGGVLLPNGGGVELTYEAANSVVRPPGSPSKTQVEGGVRVDWKMPNFGVVKAFMLYSINPDNGTLSRIDTLTGNPPPTTYMVSGGTTDTTYVITTDVPDPITGGDRQSAPSDPAVLKHDQTITLNAGSPLSYMQSEALSVSGNGSGAVSYSLISGPCNLIGNILTANSSTGSCLVQATMAADDYYNAATASATVDLVSLASCWSNFLPPINLDGSSIFKLGSTIPVKFQLLNACASITTLQAKISVAQVSNAIAGTYVEATSTSAADTGNVFRYDPTSGQYIFNLSTKSLSSGTWSIGIDFQDGSGLNTVRVSLKK